MGAKAHAALFHLALVVSCCFGGRQAEARTVEVAAVSSGEEHYEFFPGPHLHPMEAEHIVPVGDGNASFELRCSGERPLEWSLQEDVDTSKEDGGAEPLSVRATWVDEMDVGQTPRPYISYLTVRNLHYLDTGYYTCRYKGTEDDTDPETATGTFLYASDPDNLFDENAFFQYVNTPRYSETVIPCRPTHPNVSMTFLREYTDDITDRLADFNYVYDPKRGLVITRALEEYHRGTIVCMAKRGNLSASATRFLNFQKIDVLSPPIIEEPKVDNIHVGSNLTIGCLLPTEPSMPHIELVWELPASIKEEEKGRFVVGEQTRERITFENFPYEKSPGQNIVIKKELHIDLVKFSDQGTYNCLATVPSSKMESTRRWYKLDTVLASAKTAFIEEPFFNPTNVIVTQEGKPSAQWAFSLRANPNPEFIWYGPKGREIRHDTLEKYEKDIEAESEDIKLIIHDPQVEDTGTYVLHVEVMDLDLKILQKNVSLVLQHLEGPRVDLEVVEKVKDRQREKEETATQAGQDGEPEEFAQEEEEGPFFFPNDEYELNCNIVGHPISKPSLELAFAECAAYDDCADPEPFFADAFDATDGNLEEPHYSFSASARVNTTRSGVFTCKVCTEAYREVNFKSECNKTEINFFLADEEFSSHGFDLLRPEQSEVVERDRVTMTCGASIYEYSEVNWFRGDEEGDGELLGLDSRNGVTVGRNDTLYSHVATLEFDSVKLEDNGTYSCRAASLNETAEDHMLSYELEVKMILPPTKAGGYNMNGTEVEIVASTDFSLVCNVSGRPEPEIVWTKDGEVIEEDKILNTTALEFMDGNRQLRIRYAKATFSGVYGCRAENRGGVVLGELTVNVPSDSVPIGMIIGILVPVVIALIIGVGLLIWKAKIYDRKYKELTKAELELFVAGDPQAINPDLGVDDQADLLPYNVDYEFARDKLKMQKMIGSGAFGKVMKAQATGIVSWERQTTVAVKMVKQHADITYIKALMAELKIMIHLGKHINVVNLLGACTTSLNKRELLVIVEYCRFGNIQKYLLLHRNNFINQIDPNTGETDFQIGADIIAQHGNDLPRAREEDEMSAAYANRNLSLTTTDGLMTTAGGRQAAAINGNGTAGGANSLRPPRQMSVRYTADPAEHASNRAAGPPGGGRRNRQESVLSDYNDGLDQIVMTDMTVVEEESAETGASPSRARRSMSTVSHGSNQGPGWRSNIRGEYDDHIRPVSTKDLICWAYQVARGMDYLAGKKIMHGDLACRNILLASDNVVKICDFGLAKDIYKTNNYHKKSDGPLPVKWMAIESVRDRIFSTQSDVWSFGIVLWEMFSLGKTPYPGIDPSDLYLRLLDGYRMEKPEYCPRVIFRTMSDCWNAEPVQRPEFSVLMSGLGELLEDGEKEHYLALSDQFTRARTVNAVENRDYLSMMCSPDFNQQMSVACDGDGGEDGDDEEGYLIPSNSRKNTTSREVAITEEGYLLPQEMQQKREKEEDETGYLIPTVPAGKKDKPPPAESDSTPMLSDKDSGNVDMGSEEKA